MVFPGLLVGALVVPLGRDLVFGPFQLGIILSLFNYAAALASHPVGHWVDHHGSRAGILLGAAIVALSSCGIGLVADTWQVLGALLVACGVGVSFAHPAANRLLSMTVRQGRQGLAFGIKQAILPVASALAGLSVLLVQAGVGWRTIFLTGAVCVVFLGLAASRIRVDTVRTKSTVSNGPLQIRTLALMSLGGFFSGGAAAAFVGFIVHSGISRGMSEAASGLVLSVGSLAAMAVRLATGWAADRRSGGHLFRIAQLLAVGSLGCVAAAMAPDNVTFVLAAIVIGGAGWGMAGLYHFSVIRIQPDSPARASSIAQTGLFVGSGAGPFIFGALAQYATVELAWLVMATWLAIASGLVVLARWCFRPQLRPAGQ